MPIGHPPDADDQDDHPAAGTGRTGHWAAAAASAEQLEDAVGAHSTVVVLGSGWAAAADALGVVEHEVDMAAVGLLTPGVPGHRGTVRSVTVDGERVLVLTGRVHLYEGHGAAAVCHAVRTAVLAGCTTVVLTNAAGSLRPELAVGRPVLVADHLNLTGANPMVGPPPPDDAAGRFVDLTDLYSARRRAAARALLPDLAEGVYAGLLGGSFETAAEIRMLGGLGADLVGMSTVLEAIAARHLGADVVGVSLVTNLAAGLQDTVDHHEVLDVAAGATDALVETLRAVVRTG